MNALIKKTFVVAVSTAALAFGGGAVANATDRATVPDVAGMSASDAVAAFETVGFVNIDVNTHKTEGPALGSNFQPGTKVNENASVLIILPT